MSIDSACLSSLSLINCVNMSLVDLDKAVALLKAGTPVALPTETVYGLAAPIDQAEALKQIFEIKKRPLKDPLIVHVSDTLMAQKLCADLPQNKKEELDLLVTKFWPGPISFVVPKNKNLISDLITAGLDLSLIHI